MTDDGSHHDHFDVVSLVIYLNVMSSVIPFVVMSFHFIFYVVC